MVERARPQLRPARPRELTAVRSWARVAGSYTRLVGYRLIRSGSDVVELHVSGPSDAASLLIFHVGTPSAAVGYPALTAAAARRDIQTVIYSRPGYARSTRAPGRTEADEAQRSAAIADLLGYREFLVAGWSGGGPPALACAALLPDRVEACMTLASPSPRLEVGLAWRDWMKPEDVREFETLAAGDGNALVPEYEGAVVPMARMTPGRLLSLGGTSDADRRTILGESGVGTAVARSIRRAVSNGIWGWFDDAVAQAGDWGFRVADIAVPVVVRHGELDTLVDVGHGRWLAETIPNAVAHFLPDAGHSAVVDPFESVVDQLFRARRVTAGRR